MKHLKKMKQKEKKKKEENLNSPKQVTTGIVLASIAVAIIIQMFLLDYWHALFRLRQDSFVCFWVKL